MTESGDNVFSLGLDFRNVDVPAETGDDAPTGTEPSPRAAPVPKVAVQVAPRPTRPLSAAARGEARRLLQSAGLLEDRVAAVTLTTPDGVWAQVPLGGSIVIGRDAANSGLVVASTDVSRRHCRVTLLDSGQVQVEDLGSANGTWLHRGEEQIPVPPGRATAVEDGDWIRSGPEAALAYVGRAER